MNTQMELEKFPEALKSLVEAELAAGNAVVEVGHSFPAPPVGAYIQLANKVTTRKRATIDGLEFYDRNNSLYSGEFTDAQRFFFVLEPPNPPPPEPDMDLIRESHQPKPYATINDMPTGSARPSPSIDSSGNDERHSPPEPTPNWPVDQALTVEESASGTTRVLNFRDQRPPHKIQAALERAVSAKFTPKADGDKLCFEAQANVVGANYLFRLCFDAALSQYNCYSLCMMASWPAQPATNDDYFRRTSRSWFDFWTREFLAANPPMRREGTPELYAQRRDEAIKAEQQLALVSNIQQKIIADMKIGANFRTSHKEGGTEMFWRDNRFVRVDYGDNPNQQQYTNDADFLHMLQQFYQWDVSRNSGTQELSEIDTWRLILRRIDKRMK